MSGGSHNYGYRDLEELAASIRSRHGDDDLYHLAFADHLDRAAKVAHDIEWADSFDISQEEALKSVKGFVTPHRVLEIAIDKAQQLRDDLMDLIAAVKRDKEAADG